MSGRERLPAYVSIAPDHEPEVRGRLEVMLADSGGLVGTKKMIQGVRFGAIGHHEMKDR